MFLTQILWVRLKKSCLQFIVGTLYLHTMKYIRIVFDYRFFWVFHWSTHFQSLLGGRIFRNRKQLNGVCKLSFCSKTPLFNCNRYVGLSDLLHQIQKVHFANTLSKSFVHNKKKSKQVKICCWPCSAQSSLFVSLTRKYNNKLGLSCAKLRTCPFVLD